MDKIDFRQIKKLPPEEKIKVLKRIEDELQKLIETRRKETEENNKEIAEAEELLAEARNEFRVLEEIQLPELKKVEIEKLFRPKEERDGRGTAGKEEEDEGLEGIAAKEPAAALAERQARIDELSRKPMEELYQTTIGIRKEIEKTGVETIYQQSKAEEISEAIYEKRKAIESKEYNPSARARHMMTAAEEMIENYL
jgi:acyl-CoA reductase-like NAD-dependent aldehyde dehydrogenase